MLCFILEEYKDIIQVSNYKEPRNSQYQQLCVAERGQQLFLNILLQGRTIRAIIDFGAMGNFINTQVALDNQYWTQHKARPYKLLVVNEEAIGTNKGQVTHKT